MAKIILNPLNDRLAHALERRFGKSVLAPEFRKEPRDRYGRERRRCIDPETGSYIVATILPQGRIFVVAEHDGA